MDGPLVSILAFAAGCWMLHQWRADLRDAAAGNPHPKALPGASPCRPGLVVAAVAFGVGIALAVTAAESATGVLQDQSVMPASFLLATLGAAVIEELVVRGWLVIQNRGRAALIASALGVSALFTLGHPFLWNLDNGLQPVLTTQTILAAGGIFSLSVGLYVLRFMPANPTRSMLPCFAAHAAHNLAVFAVKLATGHVCLA